MLTLPGVRGVNDSVRRVRVLVSRSATAVRKLWLRLRRQLQGLFRHHSIGYSCAKNRHRCDEPGYEELRDSHFVLDALAFFDCYSNYEVQV